MLENLLITWGEPLVLGGAGALTGLLFGWAAQRSRFCLRAATVEVAEGQAGSKLAIWLIVFATAVMLTQLAIATGILDVRDARQLAATGSLSGAIVGGLMFGIGMVLARGCASRLLVLSATGNLRALVTGLVVTLVAQASYTGVLAPLREQISQMWLVGGSARDLGPVLGLAHGQVAAVAGLGLLGAVVLAWRRAVSLGVMIAAFFVGAAVTLGWVATYAIASNSFEIVPVLSVTFTGPATDTLMALVTERSVVLSFGIGLVPGVFVGSGTSALLAREWKLERFGPDTPMERYLIGATLMGFGAMLAGGCAVGAGVSGGAVLSLTAWTAVFCMWLGAIATTRMLNRAGPAPATA
ncbi:Lipocalin-related protein and Bos/Can/Equ allergen [Roseibacterium elongatum DSM 19469]|uniref:Lipocalin-related protein and Bos/Can/Equ allergen n=1 Tax=Roseicyclus elongatus DSM 19469 TaxID=1294273 RepID=W8RTQ0_9RHOB|nr:YeeE/YedE family protein [Roseibacterium elongatum]AHM04594.1 Lipocalin-related protein and Bos/Can/Equ allergen [Roseibacterium elongatum DSM 19469]